MQAMLWSLIVQTDAATKAILILLFIMSIICWTIFFYKATLLRSRIKQLKQAQQLIVRATSLDDLLMKASMLQTTYPGLLLAQYLTEFKSLLKTAESTRPYLIDKENELLGIKMGQIIDEAVQEEEAYIPVLSTCAAVATLIGLFGTVWGLIHSFLGIAARKSADISAVAPGIAEALITTLAGLLVAIPALVLYNYLLARLKTVESLIVTFSERCIGIMQITASEARYTSGSEKVKGPVKTATVS